MKTQRVGFALCGSFCTHAAVLKELEHICREYGTVLPIVSQACQTTDTRFGRAEDFLARVEELTGHKPIDSIQAAEPIGPKQLLDVLVIAPCTGNTLAKLAAGVTDTPVTMAAKAHLRNDRPLVAAIATNDGLSAAAREGTCPGDRGYGIAQDFVGLPVDVAKNLAALSVIEKLGIYEPRAQLREVIIEGDPGSGNITNIFLIGPDEEYEETDEEDQESEEE